MDTLVADVAGGEPYGFQRARRHLVRGSVGAAVGSGRLPEHTVGDTFAPGDVERLEVWQRERRHQRRICHETEVRRLEVSESGAAARGSDGGIGRAVL